METTTAITISKQYERSIELFKDGSKILAANEIKVNQIRGAGKSIINKIQANGGQLTPELDQLCNDYIAKVNTRLKEMNDARSPITQMLTAAQKMFTGLEAQLDIKKPDTEIAIIQGFRNDYARQVAEAEKKKRDEAEKAAKKSQEEIQLKAAVEQRLNEYYNKYLLELKQSLQQRFNEMTLDDFDSKVEKLKNYTPAYPYKHFSEFQSNAGLYATYHTKDELNLIVLNITSNKFEGFAENFKTELSELRDMLIARIPSKQKELIALKEADEEEKVRLAEQKRLREEEEQKKLQAEAEEKKRGAEQAIAANAAAEEMNTLFEKEAAIAVSAPAPETREGYEIEVLNAVGYMQIFQYWFENNGKNIDMKKIGNTKLSQMKAFCEKEALKKHVFIESQYLKYNPVYKAVNRK